GSSSRSSASASSKSPRRAPPRAVSASRAKPSTPSSAAWEPVRVTLRRRRATAVARDPRAAAPAASLLEDEDAVQLGRHATADAAEEGDLAAGARARLPEAAEGRDGRGAGDDVAGERDPVEAPRRTLDVQGLHLVGVGRADARVEGDVARVAHVGRL